MYGSGDCCIGVEDQCMGVVSDVFGRGTDIREWTLMYGSRGLICVSGDSYMGVGDCYIGVTN